MPKIKILGSLPNKGRPPKNTVFKEEGRVDHFSTEADDQACCQPVKDDDDTTEDAPEKQHSAVVMKLTSFCTVPVVQRRIEALVIDMNRLAHEAYEFGNLHVTRLLDAGTEGPDLPTVNHNFYYRCLVAVSNGKTVKKDTLDATFVTTVQLFDRLRPAGSAKVDIQGRNQVVASMSHTMATMASNHLWTNLATRLDRYLKWKYPGMAGRDLVVRALVHSPQASIDAVFQSKEDVAEAKALARALAKQAKVLAKAIVKAEKDAAKVLCAPSKASSKGKGKGKPAVPVHPTLPLPPPEKADPYLQARGVASELRLVMQLRSSRFTAKYAHMTLPLYYRILGQTEVAMAEHMLSQPVPDQESSLMGSSRTTTQPKRFKGRKFTLLPLKSGFTIGHIPISDVMFLTLVNNMGLESIPNYGAGMDATARRGVWARYFHLTGVETTGVDGLPSRQFARYITTDGCSVSVMMTHTVSPQCAHNDLDAAQVVALMADGLIGELSGVDPGFTDVVTVAYASDDRKDAVGSYSSARYYERAKFNLSMRRTNAWNKQTPEVHAVPTARTGRLDRLEAHIKAVLACVRQVQAHRAARGYRNMRFLRFQHRRYAINEICALVAPPRTDGLLTYVGYGDGCRGHSVVKRRCSGPQEEIRKQLRARPDVLMQDIGEFRTSITCYACNCLLCNMRADITKKKSETDDDGNVEITRTTTRNARVHKVLHCTSSDKPAGSSNTAPPRCGTTWNRDVNASRNIRWLAECIVFGLSRPSAFCRPHRAVNVPLP